MCNDFAIRAITIFKRNHSMTYAISNSTSSHDSFRICPICTSIRQQQHITCDTLFKYFTHILEDTLNNLLSKLYKNMTSFPPDR